MDYNGEVRCINHAGSKTLSRSEVMSPTPIDTNSPTRIIRLKRPVFATRSPPRNSEEPPPLPMKKRPVRNRSPQSKPNCARKLFDLSDEDSEQEQNCSWNKLPDLQSAPVFHTMTWDGRNKAWVPDWARHKYSAKDLRRLATRSEINQMVSETDYKCFPTTGIHNHSSITFIALNARAELIPSEIQISEFIADTKEFYSISPTFAMFKAMTNVLHELNEVPFRPQIESCDLTMNTQKSIWNKVIQHYDPKCSLNAEIDVIDAHSKHGIERKVVIVMTRDSKEPSTITFPWLHLNRFVYFAKALIEGQRKTMPKRAKDEEALLLPSKSK